MSLTDQIKIPCESAFQQFKDLRLSDVKHLPEINGSISFDYVNNSRIISSFWNRY